MRRARAREQDESEVNLTPMLDVVFIMLIFFIVTATFIRETGLVANRSANVHALQPESEAILIVIDDRDEVWVDGKLVDPRAVRAHIQSLHAANPDWPVVIEPRPSSTTRMLVAAMDAATLDAIVYPTWTNPPAHLDRAKQEYRGDNSQLVAPATGMPAITVPMGFSYGNLPAGLQILGRPYAEGLLFRYAYAYEQGTHHRHPPEGFPPLAAADKEL